MFLIRVEQNSPGGLGWSEQGGLFHSGIQVARNYDSGRVLVVVRWVLLVTGLLVGLGVHGYKE